MADQIFPAQSGFFDSVNHDRLYTAEQMIYPYHRLVSNGVYPNPDGTPSDDLQVVASGGMNVLLKAGEGMFFNRWFKNPSGIVIPVPANNAAYTRIDSVFIYVNMSSRESTIIYREGYSANTPPPTSELPGTKYYRLANIAVPSGATNITGYYITDLRGSEECPWVTGLIQQVDTSVLWAQFQAGYENQYKQFSEDYEAYVSAQQQAWADFIAQLTEDLTVSTSTVTFRSKYSAEGEATNIPINISGYNKDSDVLEVFINGLLADPTKYTISADGTSITLANSIAAGNYVEFVVFKSLLGGNADSTTSLAMRINDKVDSALADSGWANLTLTAGSAFSSTNIPQIRMIGNRVFLRGSVKGLTTAGTIFASLPADAIPEKDHVFTASSGVLNTYGVTVEIKVGSDGVIRLGAISGTLNATDGISLCTDYISAFNVVMPMVYDYKGSVVSYASLPSNPKAGDCWMVNTAYADKGIKAGDTVMWNGSAWEVLQTVIGETTIDSIVDSIT